MPEFHLEFCYYVIFRDFPVMRLKGWQYFLWDQDKSIWDPTKVDNLLGFDERFDDVINIFEKNNFVKEYDERYRNTDLWHDHPSFEDCKLKLSNLRHVIQRRGHAQLSHDIDNILEKHENFDYSQLGEDQIEPTHRDFLAILEKYKPIQEHSQQHTTKKFHGEGELRISHLLSRMQNL